MKLRTIILLISLVITLLAMFSTGCDGILSVDGYVYEWVDAPAGETGEIFIDMQAPGERVIKPITNAKVIFGNSMSVTTHPNGSFSIYEVVAPGRYRMDIRIDKVGYHSIAGTFQFEGDRNNNMTIFLVRR